MLYATIALKLVVGFFALVAITRVLGKKEMSQVTPYDFVYAIILGGIIEESIYDDKVSIFHVLFGVLVWGIVIFSVEKLTEKYDKIRKPLKGTVSVLVKDGEIDHKEMRKNSLEMEQLRSMLRTQGLFSLKEVKYVFMETGGQISVMKHANADPVTPETLNVDAKDDHPSLMLVDEGKINEDALRTAGKDENWLLEELSKEGHNDISKIYYAEWSEQQGFYIKEFEFEKDSE
ncbi:hypothetical protein A8F94_17675 [Bacillus sp. FJAT-27225]|uniref:DUF421 domain-containing protein n=1 Tax=Bacillus sp. FJAT-27225 TaxID=1743144 RepID=UPI00080C28FB|nr:DUF421 domain-containing protein [Bacillus sp. FJAT-27225]OCA82977.1 hypothetical protein A8F94_17675 [Bacillus sp. FJAT-27225]